MPGLGETLRVNGRVAAVGDGVVRIGVEECYVHCAKALIRSDLWNPESWKGPDGLARPAQIWKDHAKLATTPVTEIEDMLVDQYANDLYWEPEQTQAP